MKVLFLILLAGLTFRPDARAATGAAGTVVTEYLDSQILRQNLTGLDPHRRLEVYLPPGYAQSARSYPVIFYLHSLNWSAEKMFSGNGLAPTLDDAIARGVVPPFILVAPDFSSPLMGSLFENSSTSGRWLDYITDEVVPWVDRKWRTVPRSECRGVAGDFMGGRGALKLAMTRPDLFGAVYALHPVATGCGLLPITSLDVDWAGIQGAKSYAELARVGRSQIFVAICQAFLPNPNRPPFYCDFPVEMKDGRPAIDPDHNRRMQAGFLLEESLDASGGNLRSLRGLAFDWGRFDANADHVFANRVFSRKLDDLGVEHEAEEYRGNPWNRNWGPDGRFATRLLPFFARHLVFPPG